MIRGIVSLLLLSSALHGASEYFAIRVVDEKTGRGVPLVRLSTNNHITCYTDSNGVVAWDEPGLMDRDVYFRIDSPGYEFPGGGKAIRTTRGSRCELKIHPLNIAERIYRVTGQGIYRDSVLAGYPVPIREAVLNAEVLGQDTVRVTPYRGKLFWLWGDTDRAGGRLGNFATTSATSELPGHGGLNPNLGVDLNYFRGADGFVKPMCTWPVPGMKWLHALLTVRDASCNGPRSLPAIEPDSTPGFVALVSPFSILSKRSSASRVRFAAPTGAPLTPPGRFGASS